MFNKRIFYTIKVNETKLILKDEKRPSLSPYIFVHHKTACPPLRNGSVVCWLCRQIFPISISVWQRATLVGLAGRTLLGWTFGAGQNTIFVNGHGFVSNLAVIKELWLNCCGVDTLVVKELFDVFRHLQNKNKINIKSKNNSSAAVLSLGLRTPGVREKSQGVRHFKNNNKIIYETTQSWTTIMIQPRFWPYADINYKMFSDFSSALI